MCDLTCNMASETAGTIIVYSAQSTATMWQSKAMRTCSLGWEGRKEDYITPAA